MFWDRLQSAELVQLALMNLAIIQETFEAEKLHSSFNSDDFCPI
jgi:hypothetical protein